jgi:hypothetical protein
MTLADRVSPSAGESAQDWRSDANQVRNLISSPATRSGCDHTIS